jgi:hypothetical protein
VELNSSGIPPALTIDFWDSETPTKNFREANRAAYDELDGSGEQLALRKRHILSFTLD